MSAESGNSWRTGGKTSTGSRDVSGEKKTSFLAGFRRVRIWLVLLIVLLSLGAGALLAVYHDRDLLRELAVAELRRVLEREANLDFHFREARVRILPPRVELEAVTVGELSKAWVMDAERVEVSATLYALFFGKGDAARVTVRRPRLLVAAREPNAPKGAVSDLPPEREGPDRAPGRRNWMARVTSLLAKGLPLRRLEVTDGLVRADGIAGAEIDLQGVRISCLLTGRRLHGSFAYRGGRLLRRGTEWDLGSTALDFTLDSGALTVGRLSVVSDLVEGKVSGSIDFGGSLDFQVALNGDAAEITDRLGAGRPLEGKVSFQGGVVGSLRDPVVEGRVALLAPVVGGGRWPGLKGTVRWKDRRLDWRNFSVASGQGKLRSSGYLDLSSDPPRHGLEIRADEYDTGGFPVSPESPLALLEKINAILRWEGEGLGAADLSGSGSLAGDFLVRGWRSGEIHLEADGSIEDDSLQVRSLVARSGGVTLRISGSAGAAGDFTSRLSLEAADIGLLARQWGIEGAGGGVSVEGRLSGTPEDVRFEGPVRWERGEAYGLRGLEAAGTLRFEGGEVSLSGGRIEWRGSLLSIGGSASLTERTMDLLTVWEGLKAAELTSLLGIESEKVDGEISLEGRLLGEWEAPILAGRFTGTGLRYGEILMEEARGACSFSRGTLKVSEVLFRSGPSSLSFSGLLAGGKHLAGTFESSSFALRSFAPSSAAEATGEIRGRLGGTVKSPVLQGEFKAASLSYDVLSLKGGEGMFDYRERTFTLEGSLHEKVNRYRLEVEVGEGWPFEASVDLERFSPEIAREGFDLLPEGAKRALEDFSFLAIGTLQAAGRLSDPRSIESRLALETVWVYTKEQTLQNERPLELTWSSGGLKVEEFTLAGQDYRVTIGGEGGLDREWDVSVEGEIDLDIFERYLEEIENVDAKGSVRLHVSGPWDHPSLGGAIRFQGGEMKLRDLPEPVSDLSGTAELRGRFVLLTDFSGKMGGSAFIAGGTYGFDTGEVDGLVEGRLDLALFKGRVPGMREMKGAVDASLSLKGPVDRPEIFGEAVLREAEVFHQSMPQSIRDLTGTVFLEEGRFELRDLRGVMGEGEVQLRGHAEWREGPLEMDFRFSGRRITLVVEETAKALLDADLTLKGKPEKMKLAGEINILRARYFREFKKKFEKLPGGVRAGGEEGSDRGRELLKNLELDVALKAQDRFWISNSMAEIENSVDVHVGGTAGDPLLGGEVRLVRGEVTYYSRRFELYSGRIYNSPPGINPVVEAQAEVVAGDTRIYLLLEGPLRRPTLQLTSLPPHTQEDLIALLTVGHTRSGLEEQQGEALAVGAAIIFSTPVIEQFGEGAREVTGIEMIQVEPALGDEGAAARLTLGTALSDRLFMSASQSIGVTDDQQLRLEYQLFDYLSILGQQLQQGIYSLDLVVRFDFD